MDSKEGAKSEESRSQEELRLSKWMVLAQKGDTESYHKLLAELFIMMKAYTSRAVSRMSVSGDVDLARDIAQEVLLAVHNKRHTYDSSQRFLPWVFGIARHKVVDWQRRLLSENKILDFKFDMDELPHGEFTGSSHFDSSQESLSLFSLLKEISPKQREIIELTKIQGLSISEAAEKTGLTESNVKVLIHRGILALRKIFEANYER